MASLRSIAPILAALIAGSAFAQTPPDEPFDRTRPVLLRELTLLKIEEAADGARLYVSNPELQVGLAAGPWKFRLAATPTFNQQFPVSNRANDRSKLLTDARQALATGMKVTFRGYRWKNEACAPECLAEIRDIAVLDPNKLYLRRPPT